MAFELQIKQKEAENPFAAQALQLATIKTNENTLEAFRILSAAAKSFEHAGIKNSEIQKTLAELKKNPSDIRVSFGVQYG